MRKIRADHHARRDRTEWTNWSRWDCPVTCGGGDAERIRQCMGPGRCVGPRLERKRCAETPCPNGAPQYLIDQARQQLETNSKSYQLQTDDELTLNCLGYLRGTISSNFRSAKAVWYHNQERFHPFEGRIGVHETNFNLYFTKMRSKDNGVWACQVQLSDSAAVFTSVYTVAVENDKPDIEVKAGDPLTLRCHNLGLTQFFDSKLVTQWHHNASLNREFNDANPEDVAEFVIEETKPSDSGVWMCKVLEKDDRLRRLPLQWVTNVVRVRVEGSVLKEAIKDLQSSSKGAVAVLEVVAVLSVVVVGLILFYCLKIRKSKKKNQKDIEKGASKKSGKKNVGKKGGKDKDKSKDKDKKISGLSKDKRKAKKKGKK